MFQEILQDVKNAVGGRLVITPEELEAILGISVGQQANMRSEKRFPIPHQKTGKRVHYSVYSVAKHLAGEADTYAKAIIKEMEHSSPLPRLSKKTKGNHLKAGWWAQFSVRLTALFQYGVLVSGQHPSRFKGL